MKTLYTIILVCLYTTIIQSQIQQIIGNNGESFTQNGYTIEYTLGELAINTFANNRLVLTQGFHQPDIRLSTATVAFQDVEFDIDVYPNPCADRFHVRLEGEDIPVSKINLINIHGQVITQKIIIGTSNTERFEVSNIPDGIYFLQLLDIRNQIIHSTKVLKID